MEEGAKKLLSNMFDLVGNVLEIASQQTNMNSKEAEVVVTNGKEMHLLQLIHITYLIKAIV